MPAYQLQKRTVPELLKAIDAAESPMDIKHYENLLVCFFASPILFVMALSNLFFSNAIVHTEINIIFMECAILFAGGVCFEILSRIPRNPSFHEHLISILYGAILCFVVIFYYPVIGPSVWTVAFIMMVISMLRISRLMLVYMTFSTFACGMYVIFAMPVYVFAYVTVYYILQTCLFAFLAMITVVVYDVNISRYRKIERGLIDSAKKNEELGTLYEELLASEEELKEQNEILALYNKNIRANEEKLLFLAHYDTLTELPNRKLIMERLDLLVQVSIQTGNVFYVVFIDLDGFKKINDTKGHQVGDKVLQLVSKRLLDSVHPEDFLGRLGGDEFALIIQRNIKENDVFTYVEMLRFMLCEPLTIGYTELFTSASFGISVFPQDGAEAIEMIKSADTSMYKAKDMGKNNIQFFKKGMKDEILLKIEKEHRLLVALRNEEFFLVFQPIYETENARLRGFEVLIRWLSPELGLVNPLDFIPLAEEMGLINSIGEWVLVSACEKIKNLQEQMDAEFIVSVNISPIQIRDQRFLHIVKKALRDSGLSPHSLELEITESVFINNIEQAVHILEELRALGITVALDDFGTGYASLSFLRILPIDTLKIDKSFIMNMGIDNSAKNIVGDIISLGHNLGVKMVAEGIESPLHMEYLKRHKCDFVQGFLLGKPMNEQDLEKEFCI